LTQMDDAVRAVNGVEADRPVPLPLPHPASKRVDCRNPACKNMLGLAWGRFFHSRHKGRTIHCFLPARVECENCGRANDIGFDGEVRP
jgi:hypothetical protein